MTQETEDPTGPQGTETTAASGPNPYAAITPEDAPPAATRARRPMSLRAALDEQAAKLPRRRPGSAPAPAADTDASAAAPKADGAQIDAAEPSGSPLDPVFERLATAQDRAAAFAGERPEVVVGAAFAGGLILATILKRLGRR